MNITVVMTTYIPDGPGAVRYQYALKSIQSLRSYLYTTHKLFLHIADDCSPRQDLLLALVEFAKLQGIDCTYTVTGHEGIGASLNLALKAIKTHYWIYTTDDWQLLSFLDLDKPVKLIKEFSYDIVRLGPIHPNLQCTTKFNDTIGWWLDISPKTGFAFATRPFLATKTLVDKCGPFDENCNAYEAERMFAERVSCLKNVFIAQSGDITLAGPWKHIGEFEVGNYDIRGDTYRST